MTKKYCLISHTHWDREWYLPFENFRMRLVDLIDHLLEILEHDPEYRFHLDAQTIVLEDYLAIRPQKRDVLAKHIRSGRILVGPWYVQNDFHLTSGEATVRNLLIGTEIARQFGGSMPIGYAADQFGLISQLPQILSQFGLRDCVFGRGFDRHVTEFFWESEDGSRILCEHMRFWYNNMQRIPADPDKALTILRYQGNLCAEHCATSNYLLMNGVDHLEAQEDLTEIMRKVRPILDEDEAVFQDTLPEFMARVRREVEENGVTLKTFRGEFRDNGADNVLTGTLSSRVYLKTENARAQATLEKKLEPLYTMLDIYGAKRYPQDYFTYLWKLLIENHPHDSICGCSVDAVHRHMMDRFARLEENTSDLLERGVDVLASHVPAGELTSKDYRIFLLNGNQLLDNSTLQTTVDIPVSEDTDCFVITSENGKLIPFIVEKIQRNLGRRILSPINLPGDMRVNRYTIRLDAGNVKSLSYRSLILRPTQGDPLEVVGYGACDPYCMENENLQVQIHTDGTVTLTDKRGGNTFRNILALEDSTDLGNAYVYCAGNPEDTVTSVGKIAAIEILSENIMESRRRISYSLSIHRPEANGVIDVEMTLSLDRHADALGVEIRLRNALTHHRVRLLLPTDIAAAANYAGQPFDCVTRSKVSSFANDECHPNTDYVGVEAGKRGIAILQEGLYEYEHMTDDRSTLALTLLRSTGRITESYADEATMVQEWCSPEGFCLGEYTSRLAIYPYKGNHVDAKVAARSQRFMNPVRAVCRPVDYNKFVGGRPFAQAPGISDIFYRPLENEENALPTSLTLLKLSSSIPDAMIVSAIKMAENGSGMIVRLYNSTSEEVSFTLETSRPIRSAGKAMLNEDVVLPLTPDSTKVLSLNARPKEIVTIKLSI